MNGHLIALIPFTILAGLAWRRRWPRWITAAFTALAVWGAIGLLIIQFLVRMNLPLKLPTEQFLAGGSGKVLDVGAGSGRASIMVLLARPHSQVLALDKYSGYYGISDNQPDRLLANAAQAGAEERIEVQIGDMREMPLPGSSFDAVVSAYAIDHLNQEGIQLALREVHRVLRPEGQFLLMVIHPDLWIRTAYPFFAHHGYFGGRTNQEPWRLDVVDAGFEVLEQGTTVGTLYLLAEKPRAQ